MGGHQGSVHGQYCTPQIRSPVRRQPPATTVMAGQVRVLTVLGAALNEWQLPDEEERAGGAQSPGAEGVATGVMARPL